ncbi:Pre-mRNA-splicing regulator WTAP [Halotydeus destructor]|nr:Pre-mRNA-splicing regulator WTAP [Halotydeus destructor]
MNSEIPSQSPLGTEINISTSDLRVKEEESNQRKNNLGSVAGKACSRLRRSDEELEILSKHELIELWRQQNAYIESIEEQLAAETSSTQNADHVRTLENRIKEQKLEATRKENILIMRLTIKDKEIQDLMNQIDELKRVQLPSDEQLKATLVDPAVNLLFEKMRQN